MLVFKIDATETVPNQGTAGVRVIKNNLPRLGKDLVDVKNRSEEIAQKAIQSSLFTVKNVALILGLLATLVGVTIFNLSKLEVSDKIHNLSISILEQKSQIEAQKLEITELLEEKETREKRSQSMTSRNIEELTISLKQQQIEINKLTKVNSKPKKQTGPSDKEK